MNILFVHDHILRKIGNDYYSPGGLSNEVLRRYLINEKDKLTLVSRQKKARKNEQEKLIKVNDSRIICAPSKIYHGPKDLLKKRQILKKEISPLVDASDLVIIRLPSFLGFMTYFYAKRKKKNIMIELVACPLDSFWHHGGVFSRLVTPVVYILTKFVCKDAKNVLYVSEEFLQKRYPTDGMSIGCSDVNLHDNDDKIIERRIERIKSKRSVYKIGLIGSLDVNFKGHREAIRAVKLLVEKGYHVELHCLGPGNAERWKKLARRCGVEKEVFFDGTLPAGEQVNEWMDGIDVFIIPSLQEGLPRALVEAMGRGCPATGMRTGGIPELIRYEMLCRKKDYRKLADNIGIIINSPEYAEKLAKENFSRAKEFMPDKLQQRREKFIQDVIKRGTK